MNLQELKEKKLAPEWLTNEGLTTLSNGYLLDEESPRDMWRRVCAAAAQRLNNPQLEDKFFELFWNNWLCGATPVLSNMGTTRGLPISCLVGDTWLNTKNSGKQIKNIEIGDELLTHEGRYKKVIAKKSRMSTHDLYKLVVATRTTPLKITGNHPVLTNLGWVRVDELNPSIHFIATNQDIDFVEKDYTIDMSNYVDYQFIEEENKVPSKNTGTASYHAKVTRKIEVDNDLAWAFGLWMAEGSISTSKNKDPNGIRITLNVEEIDLAKKWMSIIGEKFNINGNFYKSEYQRDNFAKGKVCKWLSCNMNSKAVGNFFTKEFGVDCKTKSIPQWILDLPKDKLQSFLDGLLIGDGHFIKKNDNRSEAWSLTLANPELLLGAYNICLKLGLGCSLQMQSKPSNIGKTKYVYSLRSLDPNSIKLSKFNSQSGIQFGKLRYCPIISLEKLQENEEVFDITVADDHSFSAQGVIVHNCNSIHVGDSISSIFEKQTELAILSKNGAGVGIYVGDVRGRGSNITGNGKSEGVIPWLKCYDSTTVAVSQGSVRRGASAVYLPVEHSDIEEFINVRRPVGDVNRRCLNLHHAVCIKDDFMQKVRDGGEHERYLWKEILKARFETGEPYLFFTDNVERQKPECYVKNNLTIKTSNICNEIYLYTDPEHTFVCCLSSMNLFKYDEWKDTNAVQLSIWFLDAVIQEYIDKAKYMPGFESAVRFAVKSRALGLGVLGWHSLLQKNSLPFDSFQAMMLNGEIFSHMQKESQIATKCLAKEYGVPEWCKGFGIRNTHQLAVAPTVSNSIISGSVSAGIEPISANVIALKTGKGTFMRTNPILTQLLTEKGMNNIDVWKQINENGGSVSNLKFLNYKEKEVFLTAREINQHAIIKQAGQRQKYIDQGQSVNLFFAKNADPRYIHSVHMSAWDEGLKGLYYCRSEAVIKGDSVNRQKDECKACEG